MKQTRGMVYLVGAGPGDPGLITVNGLDALRAADVVLHDRLIPAALLDEAREDAELIDVGKRPDAPSWRQADINRAIVEHAAAGRCVVRLKGGDPFVFGRGFEELEACRAACITCVVVPGVTSAIAGPAAAGIPMTLRDDVRSFAVITGRVDGDESLPPHDYAALAQVDTLVVLMGRSNLRRIAEALIAAGKPGDTPAAAIADATTPQQREVRATLATIADAVDVARLSAPIVTIIGPTAAHARTSASRAFSRTHVLQGRRVVVTQASSTSGELRRLLAERGASIVNCPLIEIEYPQEAPGLDDAIAGLCAFDLVVFTSVHGVRAFWRRVEAAGLDARALGGARVAALGPGTAGQLAQHGITADIVPSVSLATALVSAIGRAFSRNATLSGRPLTGLRVLFPHGDLALPTLPDGLRRLGAEVRCEVVYHTKTIQPSSESLARLRTGFDAMLFCSPSAVRGAAGLTDVLHDAVLGFIGPTTADEARRLGLRVDVVPNEPGCAGMVAALERYFSRRGETICAR